MSRNLGYCHYEAELQLWSRRSRVITGSVFLHGITPSAVFSLAAVVLVSIRLQL